MAADRVPTQINYKNDSIVPLADKEPNEGAWLMEAAANVERYGHLDKDVVDTKTYTIQVNNKVLPSGLIKMDAPDIIAKYNQLFTDIVQDEINYKIASLLDFQIIDIQNDKTTIQVDVNFVNAVVPNINDSETILAAAPPPIFKLSFTTQTEFNKELFLILTPPIIQVMIYFIQRNSFKCRRIHT